MSPEHRQPIAIAGVLLGWWLAPALGLGAGTSEVFRCTSPQGDIELRQLPCDTHAQEQRLTIEDQPTGWGPTAVVPAEPPWHPAKPRKQNRGTSSQERAAQAQARQCWEKRKRLEEVNARLRHGYKAKQGIELRGRRDYYEDYLDEFCER